MALLAKSDLVYTYKWTAGAGDNPKITGFPDNALLNRGEGYEVLDFINRFATKHELKEKSLGLKVEKLIKEKLPSDTRSHKNVEAWLVANWNK